MFNLSTLSGINLQTDNYFQYTSNKEFTAKRRSVSDKTSKSFLPNAKTFPPQLPPHTPVSRKHI
jgi:hypothetical protein